MIFDHYQLEQDCKNRIERNRCIEIASQLTTKSVQLLIDEHKILSSFVLDMSGYDCEYPDSPCNSVHPSELGHGVCLGCNARMVLRAVRALSPK